MSEVRCPNQFKGRLCNQKLADEVGTTYFLRECPRCKQPVFIDRTVKKEDIVATRTK